MASGGDGGVQFYKSIGDFSDRTIRNTLWHESAHVYDQNLRIRSDNRWEWFSDQPEWTRAMEADFKISGEKSPTPYGTNNNREDFAETFGRYSSGYKNSTPAWEELRNNFPNRIEIIERILGGK